MKQSVIEKVKAFSPSVIVIDIDGTLKDLVREHKEALKQVLEKCVRGKRLRKKLVFFMDKIAMWFVKSGILPTNERMKKILITIYAIIVAKNTDDFRELYKFFYDKENILFGESKELLESLLATKELYFVTINKQNCNLEEHGISQERIIYTRAEKKLKAYQRLITDKKIDKSTLLIIGDNLVDDIKSARKLGVECLLVDNYDSKMKRFIAHTLNVGM